MKGASLLGLVALWGAVACDAPRRRADIDEYDGAGSVSTDGGRDAAGALLDGGGPVRDEGPRDGGRQRPDVGPIGDAAGQRDDGSVMDVIFDAETFDAEASDAAAGDGGGAPSDATPRDAAAGHDDGAPPDAASLDASEPADGAAPVDGGVAPRAFVVGEAAAADGVTPVTVSAGVISTVTAVGRFRLGPLPPGVARLDFDADGHQLEHRSLDLPGAGDVALEEPVILYRGQRVTPEAIRRLVFSFDDAWIVWEVADRLAGSPTGALAPRDLVARDHEIFLGFDPAVDAVVTRRHTRPGVAGDIDLVPLDGAPPLPLFVEAQPWVRWVGDRALGMAHTREALSLLESVRPGDEMPSVLDEGVPWLLVTTIADGAVAWAAGAPPGFGVFVGDAEGRHVEQVNAPEGPAASNWLTTTPGRTGLLWIDPDSTVWRWEPDRGPRAVAEAVLPEPRPRFLGDGRMLFWRAVPGGLAALFVLDGDAGERLLVSGASPGSFAQLGDGFYVFRPGRGVFHGTFDGPLGGEVIEGDEGRFVLATGGVVALVGGQAWRHGPGGAERLAVEGLEGLQTAPSGATAWSEATGTLWWLPGPGVDAPPAALAEGAPFAERVLEPGGAALFVRVPDHTWRRALPPGSGPDVELQPAVGELLPFDAGRVLGIDDDRDLYLLDSRTGLGRRWALHVEGSTRSPRRGLAAYTCDRGLFLVPMDR